MILESLTDQLGRVLKCGDMVCYPVRAGSAMWMVTGWIISMDCVGERIKIRVGKAAYDNDLNFDWRARQAWVTRLDRVTKCGPYPRSGNP